MHRYRFLFITLVLLLPLAIAQGAVQDSDLDSLTDESERTVYGTDPALFDTDGDGLGDGEEILNSTNPLDPASSRLASLQRVDPGILGDVEKRAWYLGRATGIVAYILFSLVVIHGLIMTGRVWSRLFSMPTVNAIHEYLSLSALSVVVLHTISFFFDHYLKIGIREALIPLYLQRDMQSVVGVDIGLAVSLGIIALYLATVLVFTSLYRQKIPIRLWRTIHYLGFVFYLLILFHGIAAGSDSWNPWMRTLYLSTLLIIVTLIIVRIVVARRLRKKFELLKQQRAQTVAPGPNEV